MKINPSVGFEHYQKTVKALKNGEPKQKLLADGRVPQPEVQQANTDKVMFSENAAVRAGVSRLASSVSAEVDGAASPQRMAELRVAIEQGSYYVSGAVLADAILGAREE